MNINKDFRRIVEMYSDKLYNFYYEIIRNESTSLHLLKECFNKIYSLYSSEKDLEERDLYSIAVHILKKNKEICEGKIIYYDFCLKYEFQDKIEQDFGIKMNNIALCFLKLNLEEKIILVLKNKTNMKDWEIAYITGLREKNVMEEFIKAQSKLLEVLINK